MLTAEAHEGYGAVAFDECRPLSLSVFASHHLDRLGMPTFSYVISNAVILYGHWYPHYFHDSRERMWASV